MNIDKTLKIRTMKRFLLGLILILSVLFTFMGCSEENVENEGTLDIQLATSGTKGVAPSVSLDAESYHIVVKNSSSVSVFDETVKIDADLVMALEPGLYNVAVDALNGEGKVIGRGTAEGTVEAGKSTVLSISIQEVEGKGTLSINISAENSRNIGYEVLASTGSFITSGSLSYKDGKHTAEAELPNGFYVLKIKDSDTGKTLKIESFRIVSDCTTTYDSAVSSSSPSSPTNYMIGEKGPSGGYVFYDCDADNDTGNADGLKSSECGWRYLEAAPADLRVVNGTPTVDSNLSGYSNASTGYVFGYCRTSAEGSNLYINGTTSYDSSNCTGTDIGTGKNNTELLTIVMGDAAYTSESEESTTPNYAARMCYILEYIKDGVKYDDWFLPSKDELNLMYTNLHTKGLSDFEVSSNPYYWSSSEIANYVYIAMRQNFNSGENGGNGRYHTYRVRPVRAFLTDEICEHTWDDGEITSEASCEHNGIRTYTCTECNMTKVEIIPMIDHVYGDWITRTAATTSSDGEKYRICSICGHEEADVIPKLSNTTYKVGEIGPSGGYVFYDCDADNYTGNADGLKSSECGWRYLETAPADLRIVNGAPTVDSSLSGYSDGTYEIYYGYYRTSASGNELYVNGTTTYDSSNCTGTAIGTGKKNTELHVGAMGESAYKYYNEHDNKSEKTPDYAARLCDILEFTKDGVTYTDWFLPSIDELNLMYTNLHEKGLGAFAGSWYWSSSESSLNAYAWEQNFFIGGQGSNFRYYSYRVRPVRAFLIDEICEHTWNDGLITSEASCYHNGIKTYTCTECNMTKVELIPMTDNHTYGNWTVRTQATSSSEGEKYRTCSVCGHEETEVIPKISTATYTVGSIGPTGGYIFYDCDADNDSGNADGLKSSESGWRYLEAAPSDLGIINGTPTVDSTLSGYSSGTYWINFGYYRTSADGDELFVNGTTSYDCSNCTGTAIGTGKKNTELLVGAMGESAYKYSNTHNNNSEKISDYAARMCDILEYEKDGETYTDWFLPSKDELNLMYINLHEKGLGVFADVSFWSSSESYSDATDVWGQQYVNYGGQYYYRISVNRVRPVRAFLTDEICEHTWDDGEITSEASCDHNGIKTYTCTECNMTKVEIIPMTNDHVYGDWITYIGATSTLEGKRHRKCTICSHEETETIPRIEGVSYAVGNFGPAGGRIIYDKGSYSDGWRYLEAAPADLRIVNGTPSVDSSLSGYSSGTYAICYGFYRTSAGGSELYVNGTNRYNSSNCTGTAIGTGKMNTELLVKAMGDSAYKNSRTSISNSEKISDYAARLCDILEYTKDGVTYDDWFLPSKDELNLIYTNLHEKGLGTFAGDYGDHYWSSSEDHSFAHSAWGQGFYDGSQFSGNGFYLRVRPVRAF